MSAIEERAAGTVVDELLCVNAQLTRLIDSAVREQAGISLPWFMVLKTLSLSPDGFTTMSELAAGISLSSSGATRLIDRVEEAGYVERSNCSADRRVSFVNMTAAGKEVLTKAEPGYRRSVDDFLRTRLDEKELADLQHLISKLH